MLSVESVPQTASSLLAHHLLSQIRCHEVGLIDLSSISGRMLRSPGIEATYLRIIEETILDASVFQSSAVLEQLKQRWIEKLQARLHSGSTVVPSGAAYQPTAAVLPSSASEASLSVPQHFSAEHHPPILFTYGFMRKNVSPSLLPLENAQEDVHGTKQQRDHGVSNDASTANVEDAEEVSSSSGTSAANDNKETAVAQDSNADDDDWDAAKWEPATGAAEETYGENVKNGAAEEVQAQGEKPQVKLDNEVKQKKPPRPTLPERIGERGRGIIVQSQEELYDDDEEDLNDEDLSDLEDHDPVYSDIVVAQFESVQRPHARKPYQKGQWRIKLKHGILQIDGKEILFNTMAGDLNF